MKQVINSLLKSNEEVKYFITLDSFIKLLTGWSITYRKYLAGRLPKLVRLLLASAAYWLGGTCATSRPWAARVLAWRHGKVVAPSPAAVRRAKLQSKLLRWPRLLLITGKILNVQMLAVHIRIRGKYQTSLEICFKTF